jgi:hypothetical protein
MAKPRPENTPEEVGRAVAKIREFYKTGQEGSKKVRLEGSKKTEPENVKKTGPEGSKGESGRAVTTKPDGEDSTKSQAVYERLRQARQFADPEKGGYTPQELDELCASCERNKFAAGTTHVVRLLTVPRTDRAALQERVLQDRWSTATLDHEIAKRYGTRRAGGRRRQVTTERTDLLVQLEQQCETWRRWNASLRRVPDKGTVPASALPHGQRTLNCFESTSFRNGRR